VAFDREDALKKAEKLLRQGRLDGAIAEYVRVVEDQPKDWNTTNLLGDLYMRAGQSDKAVAQYARIAEHFMREGFYPKAAALYKKIQKVTPDDESVQLNLAELSAKQGLIVDAKGYYTAVASRRRARGDRKGADEIVVRLGSVDPSDIDARFAAARILAEQGDATGAGIRFRALYDDLSDKGRGADALAALKEAVRLNPADRHGRVVLAKAAVAAGDLENARAYLDRETAGDDPDLLVALLDIQLRSGDLDQGRDLLPQLLALDAGLRDKVLELAWTLAETTPEGAFVCIETAVDASLAKGDFDDAAGILQEFVTRVPGQIAALLKLVEVCVDGGLEATMYEAQAQLADAYLSAGQSAEARVIAEDLVAREPWERAHIERFRRALVMLRVSDPDSVIAERLSGHTPFMATDPFSEAMPPEPTLPEPEPEPVHAPAPPPAAMVPRVVTPPEPPPEQPPTVTASPAPPAPPAPSKGRQRGPMEIDLASVLQEMETPSVPEVAAVPATPPPASLDDVFKGMRKDASHAGGGDQSSEQMLLAGTYADMGMIDEAINALKAAARAPRQRFEAGTRLARIYKERGDMVHAIEWMERAVEAPAPSPDEGRALLYDLGVTLEAAGETSRALAVFLELQSDAGEYRDVAARVDRLSRVQTGG
jgi:tetratricopeptide (TPR) repeat protein